MPYLNSLISQYGLANSYYANVHGSFPDYAMLTTGELITLAGWGLPSDFPISIDNLAREVTAASKTWKVYAQSLPQVGYTGGDVYPYVKRHNPFAYTTDVLNSTAQAGHMVPFSQFATDLAANALPSFSFVVPDEEHDAEDCPGGGSSCSESVKLSTADQWLQSNISPLFSNSAFMQSGVLVIWWDEGDSADTANGGGRVAIVLAGPTIKPAYRSSTFYRHENLLRTIVEGLGLGFPGASIYVQSMAEFFGTAPPSGSVSGSVSDSSGIALAGASVSFSGGSTATDASGNYSFANVPAGSYNITASDSGYNSVTLPVTVTAGTNSTLNFQLSASTSNSPGTIAGTVTNISTGAAISGATVTHDGISTTTGTNGGYAFSSVAPGTYNVTASHSGYFNQTKSVTVNSGATSTLNFALATGGKIAGTVTNSSGTVISGAAVNITGGVISTTVNTTTNSSGVYNSNWIPVGTYTLTVSASGHTTQSKSASVTTGNTTTVNFTMQ